MNSESNHLRNVEPRETSFGGEELEVVEVNVHEDGLVSSKVHIIFFIHDFFMRGDEARGVNLDWHSWIMTSGKGEKRLGWAKKAVYEDEKIKEKEKKGEGKKDAARIREWQVVRSSHALCC
jgi:hypothetical protein